MSRRTLGVLFLLAASALAGLVLGQWFYSLFLKTVPPLALSSFNQAAAHAAFLLYGAVAGLAIFLLSLLSVVLSRFFTEPGLETNRSGQYSDTGSARRGDRS